MRLPPATRPARVANPPAPSACLAPAGTRPNVRARLPVVAVTGAAAVVLALAGCSGGDGGTSPTATGAATGSRGASGSSSASASPSPIATTFTTTCDSALPETAVNQATGVQILGETAFVVGTADPSIGRLAYLNCRYGLAQVETAPTEVDPSDPTATDPAASPSASPSATTPESAPPLEIGVSLYDSAARATARVQGTVEDYTNSGSASEQVQVGDATGTVLTGTGQNTLVVADGARTVAVSADPALLDGSTPLVALAQLALAKVTVR